MISINKGLMDAHVRNQVLSKLQSLLSGYYWTLDISILSGVMPTKLEWEAMPLVDKNKLIAGTSTTTHTVLANNIYIALSSGAISANVTILEDVNLSAYGAKIHLSTVDRPVCSSAGTASWFLLATTNAYSKPVIPSYLPSTPTEYKDYTTPFIGTVGAVGSGADMELTNTALALGDEFIPRNVSYIPSFSF